MSLPTISPEQAKEKLATGACLIDIRSPDEHRRHHIADSHSIPADTLSHADNLPEQTVLIFHCLSGLRTQSCMTALQHFANGREAYILENGLNGWQKSGLPTIKDNKQPLELMRQVQIIAGSLVLLGVILGTMVHAGFYALSGFVGAGLLFAGLTGFCGLAKLLALLPYNQNHQT